MTLRDKAAVTGVGETLYSRGAPQSSTELQLRACLKAIDNAGLQAKDIDGIIPIGITGAPAEEIATNLGIGDLRFSALIPMGVPAASPRSRLLPPPSQPASATTS